MPHEFTEKDEAKLAPAQEPLIKVARRALFLSPIPFRLTEVLRDYAKQVENVRLGKSRTLDGRHLTGHALDFMALVEAEADPWDFKHYPIIANAFRQASLELHIPVVWGAVWDRLLGTLMDADLTEAVEAYKRRWHQLHPNARAERKKPLIDGPHIELSRAAYPSLARSTPPTSTPPLPGGAA